MKLLRRGGAGNLGRKVYFEDRIRKPVTNGHITLKRADRFWAQLNSPVHLVLGLFSPG